MLSSKNKNDFIYVFIEIFAATGTQTGRENKISMNRLIVKNTSLPPYEFDYDFVEAREYIRKEHEPHSSETSRDGPIEQYQFVFTKKGAHVGLAKKESGGFDIYYNGNWLDDAPDAQKEGSNQKSYHLCKEFMVTYDRIIFEMAQQKPNQNPLKVLKHNLSFDNAKPLRGTVLSTNSFFTERIKNHCRLYSGLILIETNIFVAHGRHVSQFYLKENKFVLRDDRHFSFQS